MQKSKEVIAKAGVIPKLRLATKKDEGGTEGTGPHTVKMVSDKVVKGTNPRTGKEEHYMVYTVEEDGEEKQYRAPLKDESGDVHYLVQRLAEVEEGEEVILEYKRQGAKGYIDVRAVKAKVKPDSKATKDDDIPIINSDEEVSEGDEPW